MNKINNLVVFSIIFLTVLVFSSCDSGNGGDEIPKKTGVLIVNEGNYGSGNGSISFYDEEAMTITNNVVKSANAGSEIGANVQSIYQHDGVGYLICNGPDKIEFINMENFTYVANPVTNLSQPRYMTVIGDNAFITCWGPWDFNDYSLPESYIAVMDINTKTIVDTLACGSGPEGIIGVGKKLYVANSFETSVSVFDVSNNTSSKINLSALPKHFVVDAFGNLWVATSSGLYSINTKSDQKADSLLVTNVDGKMAMDGNGEKIYLLTAQPWPATTTEVFVFDAKTKTVGESALISGENFYGIGYNSSSDKIYLGDSKAFAGPGAIYVYDDAGTRLDEQITSVGPNGFTFK